MSGNAARELWSAVACHRFGRLADLSARQRRVHQLGVILRAYLFDGDKSPAKSADGSAQSKCRGGGAV
jgi:hypothetical protein